MSQLLLEIFIVFSIVILYLSDLNKNIQKQMLSILLSSVSRVCEHHCCLLEFGSVLLENIVNFKYLGFFI